MAEVAILVLHRRRRAILLAMLSMKKETHGFHNFYACFFVNVSPISIGMGLRSPAIQAGEAPLTHKKFCNFDFE